LLLFAVSTIRRRSVPAAFGLTLAGLNLLLVFRSDILLAPFS
jgi:hypothetical protein